MTPVNCAAGTVTASAKQDHANALLVSLGLIAAFTKHAVATAPVTRTNMACVNAMDAGLVLTAAFPGTAVAAEGVRMVPVSATTLATSVTIANTTTTVRATASATATTSESACARAAGKAWNAQSPRTVAAMEAVVLMVNANVTFATMGITARPTTTAAVTAPAT